MQFPFETTTKDGRKATVIAAMPDGRLIGFIELREDFAPWFWDADGSCILESTSIILPLQIKPRTAYRMRNGGIAWTTGLLVDGLIHGMGMNGDRLTWHLENGRWASIGDEPFDLIEELPQEMGNQK